MNHIERLSFCIQHVLEKSEKNIIELKKYDDQYTESIESIETVVIYLKKIKPKTSLWGLRKINHYNHHICTDIIRNILEYDKNIEIVMKKFKLLYHKGYSNLL